MTENVEMSVTEHVRRMLNTHFNVGKEKPVSYLPIATIEKVIGLEIQTYKSMIEKSGNRCLIFNADKCCIKSGAVYAYSCKYLTEILQDNQQSLSKMGWPTTPVEFIEKLASEWIEEENAVMPVIKRAFGEN